MWNANPDPDPIRRESLEDSPRLQDLDLGRVGEV
jgi:hypothetical protein